MISAVALGWLRGRATGQDAAFARERDQGRPRLPRALPLLRRNPQVTLAIGVHGLGLFCSAASAIGMPILLSLQLHAGAGGYGLVMAAAGFGALLGNPLAGHLRVVGRFPYAYCAAWLVNGLTLAATGLVGSLPAVMVVAAIGGLCAPVAAVSMSTHLARCFVPGRAAAPDRQRSNGHPDRRDRWHAPRPPAGRRRPTISVRRRRRGHHHGRALALAGAARLARTTAAETAVAPTMSVASSGTR